MIYSSIYAKADWDKYPEAIRRALEYLKSRDFTRMECGTYPIQGKDIYALVQQVTTAPREDKKPEIHKKYVDIQFLAAGRERIGYAVDTGKYPVVSQKEENDIYFYGAIENENFVSVRPGDYSIFFPEDIHCPGCMADGPETIRKVVIKISLDILAEREKEEI